MRNSSFSVTPRPPIPPTHPRDLPHRGAGFATNSHDRFNVHQESEDNTWDTPFTWTEGGRDRVRRLLSRYPDNYPTGAMLPLLDLAQRENGGWLSLSAMNAVADLLGCPPIRVYEVATFYTMYNRSRVGRYHVQVCGTTPCRLQGAERIEAALREALGVEVGGTTPCGTFTLSEMECMGACVNAPMLAVADYSRGPDGFTYTYYEDLTAADARAIVEELRAGRVPRPGSQHRSKTLPMGSVRGDTWVDDAGARTLTGEPRGPYCRELDEGSEGVGRAKTT